MWQICMDIAKCVQQWIGDIALASAGGNASLAASYVIGISVIIVAAIAVLAIVLLKYANGLADGGILQDARGTKSGHDDMQTKKSSNV